MELPDAAQSDRFSPYVCEQLKWYVYALRNPLTGQIFYIGKGKDNRVFAHAHDAIAAVEGSELSPKLTLIKSIHAAGQQVETLVIRHGITSEKTAYEIEAAIIDTMRLLDPAMSNERFDLKNMAGGHHSSTLGLTSTDHIRSLYDAPDAPEITEPLLLIKIPRLWTPTMSSDEIYEATRQWWKLGDRREKARYALAVSGGVIREAYRIDPNSWESEKIEGKTRWRFSGTVDATLSDKYRHTSVRHLHKPGQANSVYYFNC